LHVGRAQQHVQLLNALPPTRLTEMQCVHKLVRDVATRQLVCSAQRARELNRRRQQKSSVKPVVTVVASEACSSKPSREKLSINIDDNEHADDSSHSEHEEQGTLTIDADMSPLQVNAKDEQSATASDVPGASFNLTSLLGRLRAGRSVTESVPVVPLSFDSVLKATQRNELPFTVKESANGDSDKISLGTLFFAFSP
jgi:hypothetical protein